jgi:hypothetical protein
MKALIERLRNDCYQEDEVRAHAKEAADALERLTAERDALKEGLDGWHSRYLDCEVERDVEKEHVRQCVANIANLRALLTSQSSAYDSGYQAGREARPVCLWNNVDGCWETTCGNAFEINDGTPSENNMTYCCYCGGKVEEDIK